jgi:hypothetical protein
LRTGKIKSPTRKNLSTSEIKDVEKGLKLDLPVVRYNNDKETKDFIAQEARKLAPGIRWRSGARYRLNRWREAQIEKGIKITYEDLVKQYVKLNQFEGRFPQGASGRYINFLSDFLTSEKNSTREQAMQAWAQLKKLDIPKTYGDWKQHNNLKRKLA